MLTNEEMQHIFSFQEEFASKERRKAAREGYEKMKLSQGRKYRKVVYERSTEKYRTIVKEDSEGRDYRKEFKE